jgi:hypothetical protein
MSPQSRRRLTPFSRQFMFATGIENSCPTISLPEGKTLRVDEMEKCGHLQTLAGWKHSREGSAKSWRLRKSASTASRRVQLTRRCFGLIRT